MATISHKRSISLLCSVASEFDVLIISVHAPLRCNLGCTALPMTRSESSGARWLIGLSMRTGHIHSDSLLSSMLNPVLTEALSEATPEEVAWN